MNYERTQVYLEPGDRSRLIEEARNRGMSLAGLLREIVARHLRECGLGRERRDFSSLIGVVDAQEPTDITGQQRAYRDEALQARYRKKLGEP